MTDGCSRWNDPQRLRPVTLLFESFPWWSWLVLALGWGAFGLYTLVVGPAWWNRAGAVIVLVMVVPGALVRALQRRRTAEI